MVMSDAMMFAPLPSFEETFKRSFDRGDVAGGGGNWSSPSWILEDTPPLFPSVASGSDYQEIDWGEYNGCHFEYHHLEPMKCIGSELEAVETVTVGTVSGRTSTDGFIDDFLKDKSLFINNGDISNDQNLEFAMCPAEPELPEDIYAAADSSLIYVKPSIDLQLAHNDSDSPVSGEDPTCKIVNGGKERRPRLCPLRFKRVNNWFYSVKSRGEKVFVHADDRAMMRKASPVIRLDKYPVELVPLDEDSRRSQHVNYRAFGCIWRRLKCQYCPLLSSVSYIKRHYEEKHNSNITDGETLRCLKLHSQLRRMKVILAGRDFRCSWCSRTYTSAGNLQTHCVKVHSCDFRESAQDSTPILKCPVCHLLCKSMTKWRRHILSQHTDSESFKEEIDCECVCCAANKSSLPELRRHLKTNQLCRTKREEEKRTNKRTKGQKKEKSNLGHSGSGGIP